MARHNNQTAMDSFDDEEAGSGSSKRKRLSPEIVTVLLDFFTKVSDTPSMNERVDLSEQTGVDQRAIQIWFQNRRAKMKRESCGPSLFGDRQWASLPVVNSKTFKELCLPKYLDVPFEQQQSREERLQNEAIKQFWREQAYLSDNSPTVGGISSRPESRTEPPNKRQKLDFEEAALLQPVTTIDMPNLASLSPVSSTANSIPFQQISKQPVKLFKDPKTNQIYAPQLDSIASGLDFLFAPTNSGMREEKNSLPSSKDLFSWFPELEF